MALTMMRNWRAVWKTLKSARLANEAAVRERLDNPVSDGFRWRVYSICGWGVSSDCTILVPIDESLD